MVESKIIVLLPAFNEESAIGKVIDDIRSLPLNCKILVIDNGSSNGTTRIAVGKEVGLLYVDRKGKGNAIREGLRKVKGDCVVMMDSDHTYPAIFIAPMVELLGECSVVLGWRKYKDARSMRLTNVVGNYLLTKLANLLYGTSIHDLCTGMWAFRGGIARELTIGSEGFTLEADMFTQLAKRGYKIGEYPIRYRKREGEAKLHIWDGFRIGWFLIKRKLLGT